MTQKRSNHLKHAGSSGGTISPITRTSDDEERSRQLADIETSGDDDNAECAAADLFRECPSAP
jgi:hypothetical protein